MIGTPGALLGYMARDQYGMSIHMMDPNRHPRAQLLDKLHASKCEKIYVDSKDYEETKHIGYQVRDRWYTIYEVREWVGESSK